MKERLHLPDDFAQRRIGLQHLPEEAPKSAREGKDPLSAVIAGGVGEEKLTGKEWAESIFNLRQGGLANMPEAFGQGARPHREEALAPRWEVSGGRVMAHKAVYIPPY